MPEASSVKLSLDDTTAKAALEYIRALKRDFKRVRNIKYTNPINVAKIQQQGIFLIRDHVYNVYFPKSYLRTYNLELSIKAANTSGKMAEISLYSDPAVAQAKLLDNMSYAAFFEEPEEFNSFIPPKEPRDIVSRRPFVRHWIRMLDKESAKMAEDATNETLLELQPAVLK